MAVKLRLKRMGAKKRPFYRIVAADSRSSRDGRFIEVVGTYNPIANPAQVKIDEEKVMYWLGHGAIATDTVKTIFSKEGILTKFAMTKTKKAVKKLPAKKETKEVAEKPVTKKVATKKAPVKESATKTTSKKATTTKTTAKKTTTKKEA